MIGKWLEAAKDLRYACQIDYDEETNALRKEVDEKAHKIEEKQREAEHTGCIIFLLFSIFSFIHFCLFKKFIWSLTSTMVIIAKAYDADFRFQMT